MTDEEDETDEAARKRFEAELQRQADTQRRLERMRALSFLVWKVNATLGTSDRRRGVN